MSNRSLKKSNPARGFFSLLLIADVFFLMGAHFPVVPVSLSPNAELASLQKIELHIPAAKTRRPSKEDSLWAQGLEDALRSYRAVSASA